MIQSVTSFNCSSVSCPGWPPADCLITIWLAWESGRPMLLLRESADAMSPASLAPLGLSRREAEVLAWLARGKTNPDISIILGLSVRTVHHHVARILDKLHVETRSAAAAIAQETAHS